MPTNPDDYGPDIYMAEHSPDSGHYAIFPTEHFVGNCPHFIPALRGVLATRADQAIRESANLITRVPSLGDFEVEFLLPDLKLAPLMDRVRHTARQYDGLFQ